MGRAQGKVILVGEHFAVHGGAALALPVTGRSLSVRLTPGSGAVRSLLDARTAPAGLDPGRAISVMFDALGVDGAAFDVEIAGDLPLGAGLGGSAALAAALCRALGMTEPEALREAVHRLETIAHGRPSGVDGAVVSWESPVWLEAGSLTRTGCHPDWLGAFWIAIVPREGSTREAVAAVGLRREADGAGFARAALAARADALVLRERLPEPIDESARIAIGAIFDRAHGRLAALGVSNAALDHLVSSARAAGAHGAKLTGAGLGGAVIAIAPPGIDLTPAFIAAGAVDVIAPAYPRGTVR